jgi:hypothetical protein
MLFNGREQCRLSVGEQDLHAIVLPSTSELTSVTRFNADRAHGSL